MHPEGCLQQNDNLQFSGQCKLPNKLYFEMNRKNGTLSTVFFVSSLDSFAIMYG